MAFRAVVGHSPRQRLSGALALALAIAGCGSAFPGLPTHHVFGGGPAALFDGTLVKEGPCVYGVGPDGRGRELPVRPDGFTLREEGGSAVVVDARGQRVVAIGEQVALGGGEYQEDQYDFLRTLMNGDVPPACRGGNYRLVVDVVG